MTIDSAVAVFGLVLGLISVVAGAIWCVATIRSAVTHMTQEITRLNTSIGRLDTTTQRQWQSMARMDTRVAVLEAARDLKKNEAR